MSFLRRIPGWNRPLLAAVALLAVGCNGDHIGSVSISRERNERRELPAELAGHAQAVGQTDELDAAWLPTLRSDSTVGARDPCFARKFAHRIRAALFVVEGGELQNEVGAAGAGERALDADALDRVGGLAQAGGVEEDDRISAEIEPRLDDIAGGAGVLGDDRHLALRKCIEKA